MVSPSRSALLVPSRRSRLSPLRLWYDYPTRSQPLARLAPAQSTGEGTQGTQSHNADLALQGTTDVRLDPQLNKKVWECGIKGVAYRLRIRISRRRNDEEDAKEKLYSYVQAVNVKNPKGLPTVVVEE